MKFKLDENLPVDFKQDLLAAGHDAETVYDEQIVGIDDPRLLDIARSEARILLTLDKGIGDLRRYPPSQYAGVVLFRPTTQGAKMTLQFLRRHLVDVISRAEAGRLLVVSDTGLRLR
jgi:predicted nuclease of predicted toxin-antitoxin system